MHQVIGRDVVVAIIGGTLLGLSLTRPSPGWLRRVDPSTRLGTEITMTITAFVMGGYAYGSLFVMLHGQLGTAVHKLLHAAAIFLLLYALYVHYEPFFDDGSRLRCAMAGLLYLDVTVASAMAGVVLVEYMLTDSVQSSPLLFISTGIIALLGGLYLLARRCSPRSEELERPPEPDLLPVSQSAK